ncbi:MAG TPA: CinA family protein [Caulobacteraceae bacterium]|nr:CinA family protein [Caulobacteraceae bacterium]
MSELSSLAAAVGALLKETGATVAVAESSTGGLISAALLAQGGASAYFRGGAVVYTREAKQRLGGVGDADMALERAATETHAKVLARSIRAKMGSDWGIGETGATGPTGNRYGDAPGHTCIAVAGPSEKVITVETRSADREANMWAFTRAALELLHELAKGGRRA